MAIWMLVTLFNAIMFVGPVFTLFYNILRWWIFHKQSGTKSNNVLCATSLCRRVFDASIDNDLLEHDTIVNATERFDKDMEVGNSYTDNMALSNDDGWQKHPVEEVVNMNIMEISDDYIMQSPPSSCVSSHPVDGSLSIASREGVNNIESQNDFL